MPVRKKSATDQLEQRLEEFLVLGEHLRQQVADRAPEVAGHLKHQLEVGLNELRESWPDLRDDVLDRLADVEAPTPEKKRRLRKFAMIAIAAGGTALAVRKRGSSVSTATA